jgi:hypothetical protein
MISKIEQLITNGKKFIVNATTGIPMSALKRQMKNVSFDSFINL